LAKNCFAEHAVGRDTYDVKSTCLANNVLVFFNYCITINIQELGELGKLSGIALGYSVDNWWFGS
jgi:hypothetical protein